MRKNSDECGIGKVDPFPSIIDTEPIPLFAKEEFESPRIVGHYAPNVPEVKSALATVANELIAWLTRFAVKYHGANESSAIREIIQESMMSHTEISRKF